MKNFISPGTGWFYHRPGNTNIPNDAVELTAERYAELLIGLRDGKLLVWTADGLPDLETPAPAPVDHGALIAAERYKREGLGVTVDGCEIDTTRDGQALIAGAALSAILDPTYICNWKTGTGFIERNASQLIAIASAVRAHVQACFDREQVLLLAVEAGGYQVEMLTAGWPDSIPEPAPDLEPESE
ncbi:DUF4376 domain-containing protein [Pseudomonas sp. URMO17WK12:I11]|uniref:DUF4376 domain-containing protein n=1 Tax=Pseudomonas sp. URMO17WK12:I11 TaxID=1283291 RepID=UPI000721CAAE|nr:DUF4376 domain-containing protein [Pseudomonas sp. URMO17WK12:I11]CRL47758.1 hypothetical protein PSHI_07980 [Pseudomonas sp. URMO17WK12:I11]